MLRGELENAVTANFIPVTIIMCEKDGEATNSVLEAHTPQETVTCMLIM